MTDANSHINMSFDRVPPDLVQQAAQFQTAIFADVAGRRGALNGRIRPLRAGMKFSGPALTVEVRPGDNLMIHAAIELASPGDVLIVDGKGDLGAALMGLLMLSACKKRGIAAVVLDGAVRDTSEVQALGLPVFSVGTNPNGPTKGVAGRIGHAISVGGVTVSSGDLVMGDDDGVVVVGYDLVESLLPMAAQKVHDEAARLQAIESGKTAASWLESALRSAGVLQDGDCLCGPSD